MDIVFDFDNFDPINREAFEPMDQRENARFWKMQESEVDSPKRRHSSIAEPELVVESVVTMNNSEPELPMRWKTG